MAEEPISTSPTIDPPKPGLFQTIPATLIGIIATLISLLASFGVPISTPQQAAIMDFARACIPLAAALLIARRVYAPNTVKLMQATHAAEKAGKDAVIAEQHATIQTLKEVAKSIPPPSGLPMPPVMSPPIAVAPPPLPTIEPKK